MKRILTIQDISCVGKCSLTVALPIISAFGVETSVIPTAVLSTHTAFDGFTFRDLTCDMKNIVKHWKKEGISFDALYTGYLGSFEQLEIVSEIFDDFKNENNFILVDPVMGDHGNLYTGFTPSFAKQMATLAGKADFIVPNLTEASFMLGIPYVESNYDENYVKEVLVKLTDLGAKTALLTGISFEKGKLGVYGYDSESQTFFNYYNKHLPQSFHGTGDVFASALCGSLATGKNITDAVKIAVDFTVESIKNTIEDKHANWYGVNFEKAFPFLINNLK
jgi:pyridoxine kinase